MTALPICPGRAVVLLRKFGQPLRRTTAHGDVGRTVRYGAGVLLNVATVTRPRAPGAIRAGREGLT